MISSLPAKKSLGLTTQQIASETVVYNETTGQAVCLNRIASSVWELADGTRSLPAIAKAATLELQSPVTVELVEFALLELHSKGLLEANTAIAGSTLTRRAMMQRLGMRAALMLPVVAVLAMPKKSAAQGGYTKG